MTSAPGPISSAFRTRTIASVPLPTPTVSRTPRYRAASPSNALTFGPKTNWPLSSTPSMASRICGRSGAYCAFTSTRGIGAVVWVTSEPKPSVPSALGPNSSDGRRLLGCAPAAEPADDEPRGGAHHREDDDVVEVPERVVDVLPVVSREVPRAGEGHAPDRRAGEREQCVPDERRLHHPCGDRDEGADDGREPAEEHRPVLPALEPP